MDHGDEANPAMGWRGVRMAVDRPGMIRPQLRALLAAAAGRTLWVMFPFVTLPGEIDEIRGLLDREIDRARRRERELPSAIRVGAMIETPASAWRADLIAEKVDFLSIGGNDLAQFYFAADRDSERVQRRYDPMNAGFLSFLRHTVEKVSRTGTPLSYCGEQTADPVTAAALLGVGVRQFSLPAAFVGPFRRLVRSLDAKAVSDWLDAHTAEPLVTLRPAFTRFLKDSGAALE
jgi:phosphotransferase system enzyme I (PtsP)